MENPSRFAHPRYWPTWLGYVILQGVVRLPHRARMGIGSALGRLAFGVAGSRRHIVERNIAVCFPALSADEQRALAIDVFRSGGMSIIETAMAWLVGGESVQDASVLEGLEHLHAAQALGKGVILLGTHMSTLDLAGTVMSRSVVLDVMYRANKNALMEEIMTGGRKRLYPHAIERNDIRQVIRNIKAGHVVWYGPDQDYGERNAVFAPFFGVPAATTTALSRIARITGAQVLPFTHFREDNASKYRVVIAPALTNFPSGSDEEDALTINRFVESCINQHPEQYWWFHRRFKTRPRGEPEIY